MSNIDMSEQGNSIESRQLKSVEWLPIVAILIMVALIYSPVIVNAYNGDDFVHLEWLNQAVSNPELLWRNFHAPWLDITTAKFYRPLISLFMYADYVVWHGNGIGFHLTNLLCHLTNTFIFWLILRHISMTKVGQRLNHLWCLASAALFGFYPLHLEAVSWITGRVDTFVTLFSLVSIFCYIRWTDKKASYGLSIRQSRWFYLALSAMGLALLCKEMAIILPAIFCLYELTFGGRKVLDSKYPIKIYLSALINTIPFWFLLGLYMLLRYCALGTLVGGYDNSVFAVADWHTFVVNWRRSLSILFFPFNASIISKGNIVVYLWVILLGINFVLIGQQIIIDKQNRTTFLFLLGWLVLSLVPVYKLFNIAPDLQGSRLAYMATVPLSALFCFGYGGFFAYGSRISYWRLMALSLIVSAAGAVLLVNNSAWIQAEQASQAIVRQLDIVAKSTNNQSIVYIVGLPDQISGAYVCRNALAGMSKYPQISKDIHYCFNLDEINRVFPFGYARQSMLKDNNNTSYQFYVWNSVKQLLSPFHILTNKSLAPDRVNLKQNLTVQDSQTILNLADKSCFDIACLKVRVNVKPFMRKHSIPAVVSLFYTNELCPQFSYSHKICAHLLNYGEQELLFPLQGEVDWAMGGHSAALKLVFPEWMQFKIVSIDIEPVVNVMPVLTFKGSANQNQLGFIELSAAHPACELEYDASKVIGAQNVMLELTVPDQSFAVSNDVQAPVCSVKKLNNLKGLLSLNKSEFAGSGIYELRLRAFSNNNQAIGIAGDHIVVTVK